MKTWNSNGLPCTECGSRQSHVSDSRIRQGGHANSKTDGPARWRRHECQQCQHRFTTYEVIYVEPKTEVQELIEIADRYAAQCGGTSSEVFGEIILRCAA